MFLKSTAPAGGCAPAGCHVPNAFNPNFADAADPWTVLMGQNALLGTCAGQPLVNASKPADGVLFKRLKGMECGASMPFVQPINQGAIDCITAWVNSKLP